MNSVQCKIIYSYGCINTMDTNINGLEMRLTLLKKEVKYKKLKTIAIQCNTTSFTDKIIYWF
jgi:hypothetical protein